MIEAKILKLEFASCKLRVFHT